MSFVGGDAVGSLAIGQEMQAPSTAFGWSIQYFDLPHPTPERRAGAIMRGDDGGISAIYANWNNAGWEVQSWQSQHPRPERGGAVSTDSGAVFVSAPLPPPPPAPTPDSGIAGMASSEW